MHKTQRFIKSGKGITQLKPICYTWETFHQKKDPRTIPGSQNLVQV